ncbi:MAG: M20/M25/M40 family metallo-hydrolase [Candidatus Acidiferrales bacterium]|jgi:carboxypeptidase Q|nr:M20/M25/M40 family metallo-hydrolase [Terriglobales bacterium]
MKQAVVAFRSNRFMQFVLAVLTFAILLPAHSAFAQSTAPQYGTDPKATESYRKSMESADQKIADEIQARSELMKNEEYLTTQIGPRLTGSPQMQAASQWTLKRFRDYGIDAHLETTTVPHAWYRGADSAEIVSPISRRVPIRSMGWSKATSGEVSGPVIFVTINSVADIDAYKGKLKGAVVMHGEPAVLAPASEVPDNAYDAVIPPSRGVPKESALGLAEYRKKVDAMLADSGVVAILRDSGKPHNLFNMTGRVSQNAYEPSDIPSAFLTHEDYSLLYRLSQAGPVTMKIDLKGTFSPGPVPASITVAEIKGSEHPDERVIIGGHLDSWDLGQGAVDNGTGAMAVLEAARTLKALGWQPKRTITFILYTGEEEGGVGVRLFLKNHAAEIPKMDAVLTHDTGTGRVFSIALEGLYETGPLMAEVYQPLQEVFDLRPVSTRYFGSSDHVAFLRAGVASYFCVQAPAGYREAHHSQTDSFDKVIPDQINEGAALLAAWAWNVSELPQAFPHHAEQKAPEF